MGEGGEGRGSNEEGEGGVKRGRSEEGRKGRGEGEDTDLQKLTGRQFQSSPSLSLQPRGTRTWPGGPTRLS